MKIDKLDTIVSYILGYMFIGLIVSIFVFPAFVILAEYFVWAGFVVAIFILMLFVIGPVILVIIFPFCVYLEFKNKIVENKEVTKENV